MAEIRANFGFNVEKSRRFRLGGLEIAPTGAVKVIFDQDWDPSQPASCRRTRFGACSTAWTRLGRRRRGRNRYFHASGRGGAGRNAKINAAAGGKGGWARARGGGRGETPKLTLPRGESGLGPAAGGGGGGVGLPRIAAGAFASAAPRLTLPIAARSAGLGGRLAAGTGQPRRITSLGAPRGAGRRRLAYVSGRLRSRGGRLRASLGRGRARATTARAPGGYRERSRAAYHALRRRFAA